jgi:hypothetical protein
LIEPVQSHSIAGIAAMLGLIGLSAVYPASFTPLAYASGASAILAAMAATSAAKAYQHKVQNAPAPQEQSRPFIPSN